MCTQCCRRLTVNLPVGCQAQAVSRSVLSTLDSTAGTIAGGTVVVYTHADIQTDCMHCRAPSSCSKRALVKLQKSVILPTFKYSKSWKLTCFLQFYQLNVGLNSKRLRFFRDGGASSSDELEPRFLFVSSCMDSAWVSYACNSKTGGKAYPQVLWSIGSSLIQWLFESLGKIVVLCRFGRSGS
jgi:hypothetical protein